LLGWTGAFVGGRGRRIWGVEMGGVKLLWVLGKDVGARCVEVGFRIPITEVDFHSGGLISSKACP
jgi:hypothetical protein